MTSGSILLGIAVFLIVAALIFRPFLEPRYRSETGSRRQALLDQKEAVLEEIQQLDFDHDTGKVPDLHFTTQRATLIREAAELLRELDAHGLSLANNHGADPREADIEAAIRELRRLPDQKPANGAAPVAAQAATAAVEASSPAQTSSSSATAQPTAAGFCPQCGNARAAEDKFCAFCGTQLS